MTRTRNRISDFYRRSGIALAFIAAVSVLIWAVIILIVRMRLMS